MKSGRVAYAALKGMRSMDSITQTQTGWCNKETWLMSMWLNNEYESYVEMERLKALHSFDIDDLAVAIREWVQEAFSSQTMPAGMWSDLVNASLNRVNWHQIAESEQ